MGNLDPFIESPIGNKNSEPNPIILFDTSMA